MKERAAAASGECVGLYASSSRLWCRTYSTGNCKKKVSTKNDRKDYKLRVVIEAAYWCPHAASGLIVIDRRWPKK